MRYREKMIYVFLEVFELIKVLTFFISPKRIYPEFKYLDKPTHKFSASRLSAFCHSKCHFIQIDFHRLSEKSLQLGTTRSSMTISRQTPFLGRGIIRDDVSMNHSFWHLKIQPTNLTYKPTYIHTDVLLGSVKKVFTQNREISLLLITKRPKYSKTYIKPFINFIFFRPLKNRKD